MMDKKKQKKKRECRQLMRAGGQLENLSLDSGWILLNRITALCPISVWTLNLYFITHELHKRTD